MNVLVSDATAKGVPGRTGLGVLAGGSRARRADPAAAVGQANRRGDARRPVVDAPAVEADLQLGGQLRVDRRGCGRSRAGDGHGQQDRDEAGDEDEGSALALHGSAEHSARARFGRDAR